MTQHEHTIIGLITETEGQDGASEYSFASPDAMYFVMTPSDIPEPWLKVAAAVVESTGADVVGALVRVEGFGVDPSQTVLDLQVDA